MNYTILVIGCVTIGMILAWAFEGRGLFQPPINDEYVTPVIDVTVEGVSVDPEDGKYQTVPQKLQSKHDSTYIGSS